MAGGANYALPASIGEVAATNEHLPGRELTRALIEQIARGEHDATLRSRTTRWHPSASGEWLEDAFQVNSRMPTSQSGIQLEPPRPPQWRYEPVSSGSGGHAHRHPTSAQRLLPVVRGVRRRVTQSLARRQTMRRAAISRACAIAPPLAVLLIALTTGEAAAGEFRVASCQADRLNFSTQAFSDFATRGMKIKRACNPEGPGLRGLITANIVDRGRVARGALALASINAPPGTRFTSFRWAGTVRRRDCRYALQLYADAPDAPPIALKNVRANQRCPRPRRAPAAGYRSRTFNISGATRVVQRVICVGGKGRKSCSARGSNYIRTYKAEVGVADTFGPAVGIIGDTALARGEWVRGPQPLTYDASDNVGVRAAQAVISGRREGTQQGPCALASPDGVFAKLFPCPNGL